MKKIFFSSLILLLTISSLSAQVLYHRTKNPNVGFGKTTNVATDQYTDFCVNGPLFGFDHLPVGGYVDNSTVIKNWTNPQGNEGNFGVDNTIFGFGVDEKFYMVAYSEKDKLPQMKWAFQNGPVLVKDNVNTRGTSQSKYSRSGIGFKNDGTLVVIVSLTPVTFREFADLFIQEGCSNAIYLDGGPPVGCADKNAAYGSMVSDATKLQFFNN